MEQWLTDNWIVLGSILIFVGGTSWNIGDLRARFFKHTDANNSSPHSMCGRHHDLLKSVNKNLEELRAQMSTLDQRVYDAATRAINCRDKK